MFGWMRSLDRRRDGAVLLTWDKADWQFHPDGPPSGRRSCRSIEFGDIVTNCNPTLRTTPVPTGIPILLDQGACQVRTLPRSALDPLHPGLYTGTARVTRERFLIMAHSCFATHPGPSHWGLWLSFDSSGSLVRIRELAAPPQSTG